MNPSIGELSNAVLQRPLQDCSIEELERLTREYPFFGPAQLLLAKKLSMENAAACKEQVQRASLYFTNRVWLDHLLKDDNVTTDFVSTPAPETEKIIMPANDYQPADPVTTEPAVLSAVSTEETDRRQDALTTTDETTDEIESADQNTADNIDEPNNELTIQVDFTNTTVQADAASEELAFEPYHTVDYFASQGIQYREEDKPKDRFSAQLKSFTEWLKTLKRGPGTEVAATSDPVADGKVDQMAEHSIAERHVITEAMAEVWKKQGNRAKAEEIYKKLSLLDPSKSSYFAAKIDELKKMS